MFSLWRKARRENSAASRLLGSTSLRFALHGWQRPKYRYRVLTGDVAREVHNCIQVYSSRLGCRVIELNVQPD
ncbi:transposase, partial [Thiolapillus sp.]|uniref:transposase n=1 Tax=Thiolapillus sp. TaxID=2017437 RepID=UPI003AF617CC